MQNIRYNNETELLNDLNIEARTDLKKKATSLIKNGLVGYGLTAFDVVTEDILSDTIAKIIEQLDQKTLSIDKIPDRDYLSSVIIQSVKFEVTRRQRQWSSKALNRKPVNGEHPPACKAREHFDSDLELIAAIDQKRSTEAIEPSEIEQLIAVSDLSDEEMKLLVYVREGLTNEELGVQLGCSTEAAKKRRQKVIQKLKQNTRHLDC